MLDIVSWLNRSFCVWFGKTMLSNNGANTVPGVFIPANLITIVVPCSTSYAAAAPRQPALPNMAGTQLPGCCGRYSKEGLYISPPSAKNT